VWTALVALRSIANSVDGALAVAEAGTLLVLDKFLESADDDVRSEACLLIGYLALDYEGQEDLWEKLCERLVLSLR
jgi:hypothetical protein